MSLLPIMRMRSMESTPPSGVELGMYAWHGRGYMR